MPYIVVLFISSNFTETDLQTWIDSVSQKSFFLWEFIRWAVKRPHDLHPVSGEHKGEMDNLGTLTRHFLKQSAIKI